MAKSSKETALSSNSKPALSSAEKKKLFLDAIKETNGKWNDTAIGLFSKDRFQDVQTISTGSLVLDSIIGGGLAVGRVVEIFGAEASGKTSIALTAIANVQKAGGLAVFLDVEQAFDPRYAKTLGVDLDNLAFAQPVTAEDTLRFVLKFCESGASIIVVDSIASMIPAVELEQDLEKPTIGLIARLLSKALKQIVVAANKNNCTVILLNQVRDKVGVLYGPSQDTTGGRATKFYASQRIEVKKKGKVEEGGEVIGTEVLLKCIKNKIAPPYGEGITVLTFAKGINKAAEMAVLGEQLGIIEKEGRTYYYTREKEQKQKIDGFGAKEENGRIKIATSSKAIISELEKNKALYDMIAEKLTRVLKEKQGLATPTDDNKDFEDDEEPFKEEEL